MTELGLMFGGSPLAYEDWTKEERVLAMGYWRSRVARGPAPPSIAPMSRWDLVRLVEEWLDVMPGLATFLVAGSVDLGSYTINLLLSPFRRK